MDSIEKVQENIKSYIQKKYNLPFQKGISLKLTKMDSLSNDIYHTIITDTTTKEVIDEIIYRNFGEIGDIVNHELEESVIFSLAEKGIGPKIFCTDHKSYRIDEYVKNASPIPHDALKTEPIISKMIHVLVSYLEIAPIYRFTATLSNNKNEKSELKIKEFDESKNFPVKTNQNIHDLILKDMLDKGIEKLNIFIKRAESDNKLRKDTLSQIKAVSKFTSEVKGIVEKNFDHTGFFCLNHNDTLRLNLLRKDDNILIIDHEYGGLNFIGFDIINYLVEIGFDYSPSYRFLLNEVDLNTFYNIYLRFISAFEKSQRHSYFIKSEEGKNEIAKLKSFKKFCDLAVLDNTFWFVFSIIYLDYDKFVIKKGFDYFRYAYDRMVYVNFIQNCMKKTNL